MNKLMYGALVGAAMLLFAAPVFAAKTTSTCAYIKDGTIQDKFGDTIHLGFNPWGYNYEAHQFNGKYCDAYGNASWCQQFKDVSLQMKWNDAWLSNKDCGTQGPDQLAFSSTTVPDGILDRHYPSSSYIGSGAWLTNHATGSYTGSAFTWDVTGNYTITFTYGGNYTHDLSLTQTGGVLTGTGGYPAGGPHIYEWTITSGSVSGSAIDFYADYTMGADAVTPLTTMHVIGTIDSSGAMSGTWSDNYQGGSRNGTWVSATGNAVKVFPTCTVSDFVKIVAVPGTAFKDTAVTGYYGEGMWYTDATKTTEIGPVLWGSFAVVQEIASDPCGEYGVIDYFSPFKKGLGNW